MKRFHYTKTILASALAVCFLASTAVAEDAKLHAAVAPVPRDAGWWTKRHEAMNARVKQGNVDLLYIGDSITQAWENNGKDVWKKFYGERNAVNLGIGGDRTQHVLWRLDHGNIDNITPKAAVLMIGTNNSGTNTSEEIADGVTAIVKKLRKKLPEMKILVLGIFPRGENDADDKRKVNQKTNTIIAKLVDNKQVFYLDIGEKFLEKDRTLSRKIMPDLLHLSPDGYKIWADAVESTLAKLLGE